MQTRLPLEPGSAPLARRFVERALHELRRGQLAHIGGLLTSELVTNALLHARTPVTVRVDAQESGVRVEVEDRSARTPHRAGYSVDAATGRGLALVEGLARRWGWDPTPTGKRVWFELDGDDGG